MVTDPGITPVTRPPELTVAIPGLPEDQAIARPVRTFPLASQVVAVSWNVCPAWTLPLAGFTVTELTGIAVTDQLEVPLLPSLDAMMVTDPGANAVTSPLELTVATGGLLENHVMGRPFKGWPAASRAVAVS
jgi:hypothetical protein